VLQVAVFGCQRSNARSSFGFEVRRHLPPSAKCTVVDTLVVFGYLWLNAVSSLSVFLNTGVCCSAHSPRGIDLSPMLLSPDHAPVPPQQTVERCESQQQPRFFARTNAHRLYVGTVAGIPQLRFRTDHRKRCAGLFQIRRDLRCERAGSFKPRWTSQIRISMASKFGQSRQHDCRRC
jgi:hypothetical protein